MAARSVASVVIVGGNVATPVEHHVAMDERFQWIKELAEDNHGVVSVTQLNALGVDSSLRNKWVQRGLLNKLGSRSFSCAGCLGGWMTDLAAGYVDLGGVAFVGGRAAARLNGLDGFGKALRAYTTERDRRPHWSPLTVCATTRPFQPGDIVTVEGLRVTSAQRTILDSALFGFSRDEIENAIDSSIRLRLVSEQRLRTRVVEQQSRGINGSRLLLDALIDSGGESRLERRFLALLRTHSIGRPMTQKVFRADGRTIARVDAWFEGGLVVEVAGHGTHATRRQRQVDAQRQTELTLQGMRVLTFTYEDVTHRPAWVAAQIRGALALVA